MRILLITIISFGVLFSCKKDEFSDTVPNPDSTNTVPEIPNLVFPADKQTCTHTNLEFSWEESSDANNDVLAYQVDVALDASFTTGLVTIFTTKTYRMFTMQKGKTYYWRVKAIDSKQADSGYSVVHSFFTEPDAVVNHIPNQPAINSPQKGSSVSGGMVTLDWSAADPDGDPIVYDVYFGNSTPPTLVAQDITATTYDVAVATNSTYYWKIVVKDDKQGTAISPIWNFKTN